MKRVYLGLGSNIGDREQALQTAIDLLQKPDLTITRMSSVYETAPQEMRAQPWFLNMVVEADTTLLPLRLLHRIAGIEREMGRKRIVAKGPRVIDIDILLHGNAVVDTANLTIPHPGLAERRFVLEPLVELVPEMRHPLTRRPMRELLGETTGQAVRKILFRPKLPQP